MSDNAKRYRAARTAFKKLYPTEPQGNMDGSVVGRACVTLMLSVVYQRRALPIYLVSNMACVDEACWWYAKRFRIETFFSDQKSRGFHLHKSHLSDPARLSRLMIAAGLAYTWIIFLGALAVQDDWVKIIHRTNRCDLSLFQLGLTLLEHFLNEGRPIPVAFHVLESNCVVYV